MKIRVLNILEQTMADGPGFRTAIYCAGCAHHCPGCHNPQSWDFAGGHEMDVEDLLAVIKADEMSNVTFSGGDPFYQVDAFTELARRIKQETNKTIWCWTGFTLAAFPRQSQPAHPLSARGPARRYHPRHRPAGAVTITDPCV